MFWCFDVWQIRRFKKLAEPKKDFAISRKIVFWSFMENREIKPNDNEWRRRRQRFRQQQRRRRHWRQRQRQRQQQQQRQWRRRWQRYLKPSAFKNIFLCSIFSPETLISTLTCHCERMSLKFNRSQQKSDFDSKMSFTNLIQISSLMRQMLPHPLKLKKWWQIEEPMSLQ